ncbi:class I SAM-dependent methyltransferase [Cryobacterium tepidiphilum]|uniref:Methyltransferase domain-containing protein n=1 Tax=Cryobacterium tepidiphilum TaxID=2486026 RepID=A0A3M8LQR7_9MICO|nr:class I SAM-dependent methyltransferase [Cryobacterium tepidiphilum]RNE67232.1 methyltransferase domain-containing protein [Cryobacterium tepidiphilum]
MNDDASAAVRRRFDERAPEYDQSEMHRSLADAVAAFADIAHVESVLDVGTGTGLVLRAIRASGGEQRMVGVDLSPGMLAVARAALPQAEFIKADAAHLPLADASVDLVTCVTVLHLIPDAATAVAEWARVLRPGGRAITATFAEVDRSQHGNRHGSAPSPQAQHDRFRTPELIAALLDGAGLVRRRHEFWTLGGDTVLLAEFEKAPVTQ